MWEHVPAPRQPWGGSCQGGSCPKWQLSGRQFSRVAVFLGDSCPGGSCPRWQLSWLAIVQGGSCPWWQLSGWQLSWVAVVRIPTWIYILRLEGYILRLQRKSKSKWTSISGFWRSTHLNQSCKRASFSGPSPTFLFEARFRPKFTKWIKICTIAGYQKSGVQYSCR